MNAQAYCLPKVSHTMFSFVTIKSDFQKEEFPLQQANSFLHMHTA